MKFYLTCDHWNESLTSNTFLLLFILQLLSWRRERISMNDIVITMPNSRHAFFIANDKCNQVSEFRTDGTTTISPVVFEFKFFFTQDCCCGWCLFICSAKWSDLAKALSQNWHLNGLAPVCFLKCLVSSSDRANLHSHPSHVHLYGFSPVWVLICALRCELLVYTFLQPGCSQWWMRLRWSSGEPRLCGRRMVGGVYGGGGPSGPRYICWLAISGDPGFEFGGVGG